MLNKSHFILSRSTPVVALALLSLASPASQAAPAKAKPKPAPKPAAKPAPKPPAKNPNAPVALGQNQMPGDFGQFGTTYTIGRDTPVNFTLRSAEYTITPFQLDQNTEVPSNSQKILVLHFTVHNPLDHEQNYNWSSIKFTAVDALSNNHEYLQGVQREGTTEGLGLDLKPAQKIDVVTAIIVPAKGQIPKLIVQREEGAPVIRYDLRGKVKGIAAPFADPADTTGATPLAEVPLTGGQYYPTGLFLTRLEGTAYTKDKLSEEAPEEGKRYFTATFSIKNPTGADQSYNWSDFKFEVVDADGEKTENNQAMLRPTRDASADGNLKPNEETKVRFYFSVPENAVIKTMSLRQTRLVDASEARSFTFAIPAAP
jgi:hypothetical protein